MEKTIGTALVRKTGRGDFIGDKPVDEVVLQCKCDYCNKLTEIPSEDAESWSDLLELGRQFVLFHKQTCGKPQTKPAECDCVGCDCGTECLPTCASKNS